MLNDNRYKICHVTSVDISLRYLLFNQLSTIKQRGYEVFAVSSPGKFVDEIQQTGIEYIPVLISRKMFSPVRDLIGLFQLSLVFRQKQFDIVHTHTPKASFIGQIAARMAGTPIVIRTLHGFYFHDGTNLLLRRVMVLLERFAARFSDAILSQNKEDILTAVEERICHREKISYLGNGIDLQRFSPESVDAKKLTQLREEFGLDPDKRVVGFVGRLVVEKGILEIFQAAQILLAQLDDLQFLFVGPVDVAKKDAVTPQMAADFGLEKPCKFVGFQDNMAEIYALMDVFVLPSHREGFPRSLMEASAMGVPSIATDIRGCREVVKDQENGLLVPVKDPSALAGAILTLLTDSEFAAELGQKGRAVAKLNFDERIVFDKVLQTYQDLLNQKFPS